MFQIGFKIYQYSNPGRLLTPGVQLSHQMALNLLFFDQFYYFFCKSSMSYGYCKTEFNYMAVVGGFLVFFRHFTRFTGK